MPTVRGFVVSFLVLIASIFGLSILSSHSVSAIAKQSTLTVSQSSTALNINLYQSTDGQFGVSGNAIVNVSTDNFTGYSMYISTSNSTSLVNSSAQDEITSISSAVSEQTFSTSSSLNNKWGLRPSHIVTGSGVNEATVANTDFLPVPSGQGLLFAKTSAPNNSADTYNYSVGARADYQIHTGDYIGAYVVSVVANTIVYNVTYDANITGVNPTNMPSPNPQALSIAGGSSTAESYATLSSNIPQVQDKTFGGWCDVATTVDSTTGDYLCSGTTYVPGDDYPIDQTSSATNITLYAIWLSDSFPIVWSQMGDCEFDNGTISGAQCQKYVDKNFIDTKIPLYSSANYAKDYEVHFTINSYVPSSQPETQSTIFNDKLSSSVTTSPFGGKSPGIVVRRNNSNDSFEIKSTYGAPNKSEEGRTVTNSQTGTFTNLDVRIFRIDGHIFTSLDNEPLIELHDITAFDQYFGLSAWFGAYPDNVNCTENCTAAKRYFTGELSNMYIRLGNLSYTSVSNAQITNTSIMLAANHTETINITNASELEPYTFASNDANVATVDSRGVVTAVGNGTATITMTGVLTGTTQTITVSVGGSIIVDFDSHGGTPATYQQSVAVGDSFSSLPNPSRAGYELVGWFANADGTGAELTTSTVFGSNTPTQYYALWEEKVYVCKIATRLHSETCSRTDTGTQYGCKSLADYKDATFSYGSLVSSTTMTPGDAYDCDINYDGNYDDVDERFYYFGTDNGNAKFVYSQSLSTSSSSYSASLAMLPTSSDPNWDNPHLQTFGGNYNGTVGRFMTYAEAYALCGTGSNIVTNGNCFYLLEKSGFAFSNITDGIWLENDPSNVLYRIQAKGMSLTRTGTQANAPRPTIEVPTDYVEPYVASYTITFVPNNGGNSFTESVPHGTALGNKYPNPDPTYTDHIFLGWYTAATGGTLVTDQTVPDGDDIYEAQWEGTVDLAQVSSNNISIVEGNTTSLSITNASDLESFTCSSSDSTIASVDATTCVITAVSEGTATISITGDDSHITNSDIVTVTVVDPTSTYRVTFDKQNGESSSFVDIPVGNQIGADMPQDPTYTNHAFVRWYDVSNDNTVTSSTIPVSDMTVYAEWKLDVTQAIISNNDLTLAVGEQFSISVSNSQQLEPYIYSTSNSSIATVDANTGFITGIAVGQANIIMTGTLSGLTKTLEVDVTAAPAVMRHVTFNANGGTTPTPYASVDIEDGHAIGSLPTTTKADNMFFGWYTDDGTFYKEVTPDTVVNEDITYYAKWVGNTSNFGIVWAETNACTFDGTNNVSGDYCSSENKTKKYIDTGVQLFIQENYDKDFEVGFTIKEYTPSKNGNQGTFVNSKWENSSNNYPGFVVRRYTTTNNIEITQKWKGDNGVSLQIPYGDVNTVKIVRHTEQVNGTDHKIMYYSINNGTLTPLQDFTAVTHIFFDTKVWFGASANSSNAAQRPLNGTLMDMYIKMGVDDQYSIGFDINGGSFANPSDSSRVVLAGSALGTLPTPTPPSANFTFDGWFDESTSPATQISDQTVPTGNKTYVAHYSYQSSNTPVQFDVSNNATRGYQYLVDGWTQSPVNLTTFNKALSINDSTWGDTTQLSELQYWNGVRDNFVNNQCLIPSSSDAVKPLSTNLLSDWVSGTVDCSKPDAYDTNLNTALTVRLNDAQGAVVSYAKATNGVIHNMIPGQTYYWEKSDDSSVYGYVTATSNKGTRWVDTGTIRNVRDLGGLPVTYTDSNNQTVTGTLAYGRLFRGEKLNTAPATELTNLGITTEYNVGDEYQNDTHLSDYHLNQVIHYNFDYNNGDETNANSNYMKAWTAITNIMTDITNTNTTKNVYFHCRVGADRTGTVAYLLEGLLGVPDEMRYEEYSLTNLSGLYDRTRYYKQKSSMNNLKFVYMMGFAKTNSDIYNWYMHNPNADASLIQRFRTAMTVVSN